MTRSVWKGPFVDACLFKQKKELKIFGRDSIVFALQFVFVKLQMTHPRQQKMFKLMKE